MDCAHWILEVTTVLFFHSYMQMPMRKNEDTIFPHHADTQTHRFLTLVLGVWGEVRTFSDWPPLASCAGQLLSETASLWLGQILFWVRFSMVNGEHPCFLFQGHAFKFVETWFLGGETHVYPSSIVKQGLENNFQSWGNNFLAIKS